VPLVPLSRGATAAYTPWDWTAGSDGPPIAVPPSPFVILEGVSSSREAFRPFLAFPVWVETDRALRLQRGLTRDGEDTREQWLRDMANEDEYIARERPDLAADLVFPGADPTVR
jgi:uridine kinase